jgi:hypothetical protein
MKKIKKISQQLNFTSITLSKHQNLDLPSHILRKLVRLESDLCWKVAVQIEQHLVKEIR